MTQTEIAAKTGIDRVELNRMVNGKREPKPAELAWLAKVLGVEPETLLEGIDTAEVRTFAVWADRVLAAEARVDELREQLAQQVEAHEAALMRRQADLDAVLAARATEQEAARVRLMETARIAAEREAAFERDARQLRETIASRDEQVRASNARIGHQAHELAKLREEIAKDAGRMIVAGLVGTALGALLREGK